ncbi:MAG: hypothetical protein LBR13_00355 [Dysgonamonadaceae bacterium]|jgi:hypothetical protein|nr:hypothetical protein [Dysgonamonadaceae bacterium]
MKIKYLLLATATALISIACNPIEDKSLRDMFENAGAPISQSELDAALSVTQPIPNSDDKVEGDQYVVVKNSRPEIGGVWHYITSTGEKTLGTDCDTIVYGANGSYDLWYTGISANQIVTSKRFTVEVTNCFDDYDRIFSGAVNKADRTAKKTWKFLNTTGALYNGMYGNWKYYECVPGLNSWGTVALGVLADYRIVFEFNGHVMKTYDNNGSLVQEGTWSYTHEQPEQVIGEFITTIPLPGQDKLWNVFRGASTPYWIVKLGENSMTLCFPSTYNRGSAADWDIDAGYFFFVSE